MPSIRYANSPKGWSLLYKVLECIVVVNCCHFHTAQKKNKRFSWMQGGKKGSIEPASTPDGKEEMFFSLIVIKKNLTIKVISYYRQNIHFCNHLINV